MLSIFAEKLNRTEQLQLIKFKVDIISAACEPIKIILIGSASRLQMTAASDVDLVVILSDKADVKKEQVNLAKARSKDSWPQDVLIVSQIEFDHKSKVGGIMWIADQEGVEVYPRFNLEKL